MAKRRNSKLFKAGDLESVGTGTGESVPVEGGGLRMLPGPPGACEMCHVKHDPGQPHDQQSLAYQMKFHALHGRWPLWTDAMSHCAPEVQAAWREELVERMRETGMEVPDDLKDVC